MMKMTKLLMPFTLIFLSVVLFLCVSIEFVSSSDDANEFQSKVISGTPSNANNITEALYLIAQILRNNQNHSNLYERLALLEASATLTQNQNIMIENRVKELENKVLHMNNKLETLSELLERAEVLETSTKTLMENFEEKLSTLATEILRLKNTAAYVEGSLTPSGEQEGNFLQEDTREVGIREVCFTVTSSSFSLHNGENCWFTFEGKIANWTKADYLCRLQGGILASLVHYHLAIVNLTRGSDNPFWILEASKDQLYKNENPSSNQNNLENSESDFPFTDVDSGDQIVNKHLVDVVHSSDKNKSSGVIDIRSLPNLEAGKETVEKNVYVSNVRVVHDAFQMSNSIIDDSRSGKRVSKRSSDDFTSLVKPDDAVKFNEFLLMQNGEDVLEVNSESQQLMSDSNVDTIPTDLLSFLIKGSSTSGNGKSFLVIDQEKSCPMVICVESKCEISVDDCSKMKSFWCKRQT